MSGATGSGETAGGLSLEDRRALLGLARQAIQDALAGRSAPAEPGGLQPELAASRPGVFVTLYRAEKLRGCIGQVEPETRLARTVIEMAAAAATRDPRFPPVAPGELESVEIEISLLHDLARAAAPLADVRLGLHGLMVRQGGRNGVYLPKVPVRQGWTVERFLEETAKKAGLAAFAWREAEVYRFSVTAFSEAGETKNEIIAPPNPEAQK